MILTFKTFHENMSFEEDQYLRLIKDILIFGDEKESRSGKVKSIFGYMMKFNLVRFPLLTTKFVPYKMILKELLWFIRGQTDNKILQEQGVHIWDGNSSKEFLENQGLSYEEGFLGPIYGYQWRSFDKPYNTTSENKIYKDQLQDIIDQLKNPVTRYSRRLVMTAWNPNQIQEMALPPCHIMSIFNVSSDNKLSCMLTQRSGDVGLGIPFNIASYAFLTCLLAHHCDLKVGDFVHTIADAHIYEEHFLPLEEQLTRIPYEFPTLKIIKKYENINDYQVEDFIIEGYQHHQKIKMDMKV